MKNKLKQHR